MKTIGVIGGIGPQATMDFEARLHRASLGRIPSILNTGYPPLIVWYLRHPPVVMTPTGPLEPPYPHPGLLEAAQGLGEVADLLVITSNGAHIFQREVEVASGKPVASLVDSTMNEVRCRGWGKVGVLGLGEPRVYLGPLRDAGIKTYTIGQEMRDRLDATIFRLVAGETGYELGAVAREAVAYLRAQGVDGVILGCTEIPLLLGDDACQPDLINPMDYFPDYVLERVIE